MPLHAISETLGTEGLIQRFSIEVSHGLEVAGQHQANQALIVANQLHFSDQRVREPYVNHVLRVATRMMAHYEVRDPDVIGAGLLHDSVEDHAKDLAAANSVSPKQEALATLSQWFNPRVSAIVGGVTNPEFDPAGDKSKQYLAHLEQLVGAKDPWLLVVKLSDFTDNATGLIYTSGPKVPKLAAKYLPAIPIFRGALERADMPLSPAVVQHISGQLDLTQDRLTQLAA